MKKFLILAIGNFTKETPVLAKFLQGVFSAVAVIVAAIFVFWGSIPTEFKESVSPTFFKVITYSGVIAVTGAAILQFLTKKNPEQNAN